ncbi:MAG: hypothetical protein ACRDL5_16805 [Solirubrobacteraceae bacterium]
MSPAAQPTPHGAFDSSVPVLVLRRSLGPFQHCALAVARSLGRVGVPVHAVRSHPRDPATRSRYLAGPLDLPTDVDDARWAQGLLELPASLDGAILLAIDDLAAVAVGDHQERLLERFRLPAQPAGIQRRLASKRELWQLCCELGLPTPHSTFPVSEAELLEQASAHGYPVVVKRAEPWYPARDRRAPSVAIAQDRAQLLDAYRRMESDAAPQVMLQEYIPGGSDSVWMFNGCFGDGARALCAFTGRKLRQCGRGTGPTTLGLVIDNEQVAVSAKRLMEHLDYRGIVDMGFRYDPRDAGYKLLDVNPRLGSTFRLFAAANGLDVVRALHLELTERPVPDSINPDGRLWLDEPRDTLTAAQMLGRGALSPVAWLRSLRGIDEGVWWAADDPWPAALLAAKLGPHGIRTLVGRR